MLDAVRYAQFFVKGLETYVQESVEEMFEPNN